MDKNWYKLTNEADVDSPSLVVYRDRMERNISRMIDIAGDAERLMVHIKTTKTPEIVQMLLASGIRKFKAATIAEAEMVARAGGQYLILAHQLVGPKIKRLIELRQAFPHVFIASLVDDKANAERHAELFATAGMVADVFLDINNGMNRSGHPVDADIFDFYQWMNEQPNLNIHGLHVYDGHLCDSNFEERKDKIDNGFNSVNQLVVTIEAAGLPRPVVVAGGTPAFTSHAERSDVYCSPGTCVLWDWGYGDKLTEQPFEHAALVLARVISKPAPGVVTLDMGHKAIAAENPIDKRIRFLNLDNYILRSQSEEHGVLEVSNWEDIQVGDALYGIPYHICPTVNLYEEMQVVDNQKVTETWQVVARKRKITI